AFILKKTGGGTSTPPAISFSPASLTFASQAANTTSPSQLLTVTNTGGTDLTITNRAFSGDFATAGVGNCASIPFSLAPGANCTFSVQFTPTAAGTRTGQVSITDNATGSSHIVALTGTGGTPTLPTLPAISFSPASLTF